MFFGEGERAIKLRQHRLAEILLQVQIEGIQQIVFGSKVAEQCAFSDARVLAIKAVEAAIPDCANAAVAASSKACFLSSLFGRATKLFLLSIVKTLIETRALTGCNAQCQRSKTS